jgi:hypothetical protein
VKGLIVFSVEHPHPDKLHVRARYRRHIMDCKKRWGSARSLIHYRQFIQIYLRTKEQSGANYEQG